jgi:hypothetical protein
MTQMKILGATIVAGILLTSCQLEVTTLRVATFNIWELSMDKLQTVDESGMGTDEQVRAAADIIQRIRPHILVINEIDHEYGQSDVDLRGPARQFIQAFLKTGQSPIDYPYVFAAPCNTGLPSGRDLNNDGHMARMGDPRSAQYAADCYGWGEYPGQYSMALLSQFPIDEENVRTFQTFPWKDLPEHHLPTEFYGDHADHLRLSSKSHWDVPVRIDDAMLHLLMSHPTPRGFDGDEDRNGRRNHDELKFWVHYLENDPELTDDQGRTGGYDSDAPFVLAGDFNADPSNEAMYDGINAINQLLTLPQVQDLSALLSSEGATAGRNPGPPHYPERSTARFGEDLRVRIDYLLPSRTMKTTDGGVYWPSPESDPQGHATAEKASDHRMVWMDITWPKK